MKKEDLRNLKIGIVGTLYLDDETKEDLISSIVEDCGDDFDFTEEEIKSVIMDHIDSDSSLVAFDIDIRKND